MGFHRLGAPKENAAPVPFQSLDSDLKHRLWISVYILDRYLALITGRPCLILDSEWNTEWPTIKDTKINCLIYHARLMSLLGSLVSFSSCIYVQDVDKFVGETIEALLNWYRELPPYFVDLAGKWGVESFLLLIYHVVELHFLIVIYLLNVF